MGAVQIECDKGGYHTQNRTAGNKGPQESRKEGITTLRRHVLPKAGFLRFEGRIFTPAGGIEVQT